MDKIDFMFKPRLLFQLLRISPDSLPVQPNSMYPNHVFVYLSSFFYRTSIEVFTYWTDNMATFCL